MIVFTSDIDWAPDEVIFDTIKIFEKFNVKCTFFCTHKSKILDECNRDLFELGIHPNFNPSLIDGKKIKADKIIESLQKMSSFLSYIHFWRRTVFRWSCRRNSVERNFS